MISHHIAVIPQPESVVLQDGRLVLDADTNLVHDEDGADVADWIRSAIGAATGLPFARAEAAERQTAPNTIRLRTGVAGLADEAYALTVTADGVTVDAGGAAGLFYGAQTLRQLLPAAAYRQAPIGASQWSVPFVEIVDKPRFGWRGCLLDVARHFLPKPALLRFIDLMAVHKLNVLHLHLTEDQGWRIEIKRYPKLTEVGSWRKGTFVGQLRRDTPHDDSPHDGRPHGGYYTQDDIREIVAYAAARHITVVPEIDVPGHSAAAIAAYPELGNADVPGAPAVREVWTRWGVCENVLNVDEATLDFYRNVFDEVMDLFPSELICVGGDECPKREWRESPEAQARRAELGLRDEYELQSWFIRQLNDHFIRRGRRLFGWDEILEGGLAPGATVASWRGMEGAVTAASAGHDVVTCPHQWVYLDYPQSDRDDEPISHAGPTDLARVYAFEPVPVELDPEQARHVLGSEAALWSEYIPSARHLDYMAYPRLSAFAETVWSSGERDFDEFSGRLETHLTRLDALGVEYRHASGPLPWQARS